ncbi:MAG: ABC transporter substrate-binding protein, partial [Clostridia bacterium]|nr:ABC transporter substrate-binding protein [Clostridia bacterium]
MKKLSAAALLLTLLTAFLCSCVTDGTSESGYTFTDDLGRTVTVTSHDRTAALLGSYADMWSLAGGSVCASADDAWEDFNLNMP